MQDFLKQLQTSLHGKYTEDENRIFGNLILEKLTGFSRARLLADKSLKLTENQRLIAGEYVKRLENHEPIQYIVGETEFFDLKFKVTPSVLIPRPETEELVDWVVSSIPIAAGSLKGELLDIGSGSGCIAIALKKRFPHVIVSAMDVSVEALKVARENAELNHVKIKFIEYDILNPKATNQQWDIIVSNPPYIPISERSEMERNVVDYEPHLALFVEDGDPLVFYRKIAEFATTHLYPGGEIYFEVHRDVAQEVAELLRNIGFGNFEIRKDISGNERMVRGRL